MACKRSGVQVPVSPPDYTGRHGRLFLTCCYNRGMPKASEMERLSANREVLLRLLVVGVVVFLLFGWLWWQFVFTSPHKVFWRMVNNSMTLTAITRHVVQTSSTTDLDQTTRLRYGSQNAVATQITLTQKSQQGNTIIKTEGVGTTGYDYSRYTSITTPQKTAEGKPLNFSKIINVWGRSATPAKGQKPSVQYLGQAALGLVPFVNLNPVQRHSILHQMMTKNVYTIDYTSVKRQTLNGKGVYVYDVSINPPAYIGVVQQVVKAAGLTSANNLDPSAYQNSPPLKATFYVERTAGRLVKITYANAQQTETYRDYGLDSPIAIPAKTVPLTLLQEQLQAITQ